MGLLRRLFGSTLEEKSEQLPEWPQPNRNSIALADQIVPLLEIYRTLGFYDLHPVLTQCPDKRKLVWAFFYGYVVGMGMGFNRSVSEVEDAAFLVFQKLFAMTANEAGNAIAIVQQMSETDEGLKCMMAGKTALERFMTGTSQTPLDCNDIEVLL